MEKAFWGMIAGCALAFGVLLAMYLNKAGVINFSPEQAVDMEEASETSPQHSMSSDELYALVYGDEWEEEKIIPDSEEEETEEEKEAIPHFYMQSGLCYEKMSLPNKLLMKMMTNVLSKEANKSDVEQGQEEAIKSSHDNSDPKYAKPLIEYLLGE